jgi:hypothetical protein
MKKYPLNPIIMRLNLLFLWLITMAFVSCNQKSQESPLLQEALAIQDSAIHTGMDVEDIIAEKLEKDTSAALRDSLSKIQMEVQDWKKSMIIIPGMEHDHSHEGHDHEHHHHHHEGGQDGSHLSPEDLKKAQESWKAAIENIKSRLVEN